MRFISDSIIINKLNLFLFITKNSSSHYQIMKAPNPWYVITGAPCSGKTSVIDELAKKGYETVPEAARAYIEEELSKGRSLMQLKKNKSVFERHILHLKKATEVSLPSDKIIFFDRAIPDSIAYYKLAGLDPSEAIALSKNTFYRKVFLLDRLQFKRDRVRAEDDMIADKLEALLAKCYCELGYSVIRVPVTSVKNRAETILKEVTF